MATLRDIKNRIKGVKSTQQITKAMKMVAAAKLRRAQDRIINARPYANQIFSMLSHLVTEDDILNNEYIIQREVQNVAVVVVTSDRGLCGAFNSNIIKETGKYIEEELQGKVKYKIYCVGRKANDFFRKTDNEVFGKSIGIFSSLTYQSALDISNELIIAYLKKKFDKVIIIYNEFKSIIQQRVRTEQLLPVPIQRENNKEYKVSTNYIYEPGQKEIFNYILPKHLKTQMWRILLESNAAEFAAQMTAMDNATTNANEMIRMLNIKFNKERQAAITKEILEIVSGANALKASS
jgi:F-type H+-transporting ATPase subunit gamma